MQAEAKLTTERACLAAQVYMPHVTLPRTQPSAILSQEAHQQRLNEALPLT